MAVQRAVADSWKQVTGKPLLEGYGLTETSPVGDASTRSYIEAYNGSIGLPLPSTDSHDPRRRRQGRCRSARPARSASRGPQVMKGYWKRPEETAKVMSPTAAFRTGDIGIMDAEGYVKIVDRKKDMILVSGFNVYPNEIEDVVAMMPGVLEVRRGRRARREVRRGAEACSS